MVKQAAVRSMALGTSRVKVSAPKGETSNTEKKKSWWCWVSCSDADAAVGGRYVLEVQVNPPGHLVANYREAVEDAERQTQRDRTGQTEAVTKRQ